MKQAKTRVILIAALCLIPITAASCSGKDRGTESSTEILEEDKSNKEEIGVGNISVTPAEKTDIMQEEKDGAETVKDEAVTTEKKIVWSFQTKEGIASSPVIMGELIYFGSKDGNFYAVNKDTGAEVWRYTLATPILCQPAILDDTVFFSSNEVYIAVNALTGDELWKYDLQPDLRATFRKDQWDYHDSSPVVDNGVVYFGSGTGAVLGFDASSGEITWEFNAPASVGMRSTPLIQDGVIYYGDWAGNYRAVKIATKDILWENSYQHVFQSGAAMKDGVIFIGGRDTSMHAIDSKTGESMWSYKDPDGSWITGDPVIDGDIVYFSTSDAKKVYAMNSKDGTVVKEYPIYKNSFSKVIVDSGLLYVTTGDAYTKPGSGKLEVYNLNDNQKCAWEVSLDNGGVFTSPLLDDGIIYFGCEDGCLYAIEAK